MTFEFNSRDTYKTFRANWKAAYLANIEQSQKLKAEFKEAAREVSLLELSMERDKWGYLKPSKEWYTAISKVENLRYARAKVRTEANEMLSELQAAKEEAHRQWLEAQAAK